MEINPNDHLDDDDLPIFLDDDRDESDIDDSRSESDSDMAESGPFRVFTANGLAFLLEGQQCEIVTESFIIGMGIAGGETRVVAVYKISSSEARSETLRVFTEAVSQKCGGDPNIKYAWYGGAREEILKILEYGFSRGNGACVWMSPFKLALDAAATAEVDDEGLMHLVLCKVMMGKSELVRNESNQTRPSSDEFDSGVDDLVNPKRYIVWSVSMNSHICPVFVVSFKAPSCLKFYTTLSMAPQTNITFMELLTVLKKMLPASKLARLDQLNEDHSAKKITLPELYQILMREFDGNVFASAVKLAQEERSTSSSSISTVGVGGCGDAFPAPGKINLPHLMKVLPSFVPASTMEVLSKLSRDQFAKKISLAELDRQVRLLVDRKAMASAIRVLRTSERVPAPRQSPASLPTYQILMASLSRFLPPAQIKILVRLFLDYKGKKITSSDLNRRFRLIVDDKVMASAIRLVTPSSQGRSATTNSEICDLLKLPSSYECDINLLELIPMFESSLPPEKWALLAKSLEEFKEKKITRNQLLERIRIIVGKDLWVSVVKVYKANKSS